MSRTHPLSGGDLAHLVMCAECCAVLVDDDEGANVAQHYAELHPESKR